MKKEIKKRDIKVGKQYFFVNTNFEYINISLPTIKKRTIYRVVGHQFSTKDKNDRYEVIRVIAYKNEKDANESAKKDLLNYKKYLNKEIDNVLEVFKKQINE